MSVGVRLSGVEIRFGGWSCPSSLILDPCSLPPVPCYENLPLSLQKLGNAKEDHIVDKCWILMKSLHHARSNGKEVILVPIEESYDWLYQLHNDEDLHLNVSDMIRFVR